MGMQIKEVSPVIVSERSANRKIGNASSTLVSLKSCPPCALKTICYTANFPMVMHTKRVTDHPESDPVKIARIESRKILSELTGKRDLRLKTAGDSRTRTGTRILAKTAGIYSQKHGKRVWTYTHSEKTSRADWGSISILRSLETHFLLEKIPGIMGREKDHWVLNSPEKIISRIRQNRRVGFASALVFIDKTENFPYKKLFFAGKTYDYHGEKIIPCPYQTRGFTCTNCRLCLDDKKLIERKVTIGFWEH